ncbi:alpha/beta hydrolase family protein [Lysobacter olei]
MKQVAGVFALALLAVSAAVNASGVDVAAFVKKDRFGTIRLSPKGDYYAATVPLEDRTILVVMRRADNKVTGQFAREKNTHVEDFTWVNDERLLISTSEKFGDLAQPQLTGEIYAINADGSQADILVGQRVQGAGLGTKIQSKRVEMVAAELVDDLPADDRNVIIAVRPFADDPFSRAERMDVYSGRRTPVALAPVRNADFVTDNTGEVRFAVGAGVDNRQKLYYRSGRSVEWTLLNDESQAGLKQYPIGFSADNAVAYLEVERSSGPNVVMAFDVASGKSTELLRDDNVDPAHYLYLPYTNTPFGVLYQDGRPRLAFFDEKHPRARLYRSLEAAFAPEPVLITSQTADGSTALIQTWSDRNPGDFFLFDLIGKKASHLISRRTWFNPDESAEMRPVTIKARDGLELAGYVTYPKGKPETGLPMVVMPHGGPFGIRDTWSFDDDAQMLAAAGYAVLQVNFRGSGGYGKAFVDAGAREWGGRMQDDLTDATRWAISQRIADAGRICVYGASYGAYAALMGVAKEPDLYRCAVGYIGVYDLPTMHTDGDVQRRGSGETFLKEWLGPREELGAVSPNRMADRIKVPVFLAAGGEDERAPIAHTKMMEQALRKAGGSVQTLYFPNEGHGFYVPANREAYYTQLLRFLADSLGGKLASANGAEAGDPKSAASP